MANSLPLSEVKNFFLDAKAHFTYHLLYTDGKIRNDALQLTEDCYHDPLQAAIWFNGINDIITEPLAKQKLMELYDIVTHDI